MKFSIIARQPTWHTDQLVAEGKKRGIEVEVINIHSLNGSQKIIAQLGEVVLWRSSSLEIPLARSIFLQQIDKKKYLFNRVVGYNPLLPTKFFQQKAVNPLKTITGIPTYHFHTKGRLIQAIKQGLLKYPMVMKNNLSARGEGVSLVKSIVEVKNLSVDFCDYVFQNFIKNDGDVRVLVLGGMALGLMKRVKGKDDFRNNVSLGGAATDASGLTEAEDLKNKALSLASKFGLQFCGVDFIFDQEEKIWRFMEVNTVPQWQGFGSATGVNVAEKVLDYVIEVSKRSSNIETADLVRDYYDKFAMTMRRSDQFHLYSRLWLVSKDRQIKGKLDELKSWYLGETDLNSRVAGLTQADDEKVVGFTERKRLYRRYPDLLPWNNLLFWWLMGKEVYKVDLGKSLERHFSKDDLIQLVKELKKNENAVRVLSSAAMNFFYLVEIYTEEKADVDFLWQIHKKEKIGPTRDAIKQKFYFLSHLVVAGSYFYAKNISGGTFLAAVKEMESMLFLNYFKISLDMKFEFLVSAELVKYQTKLREVILDEAERSLSPIGNFLVDTHNAWIHGFGHKMGRSEHRNALYLMACSKVKYGN